MDELVKTLDKRIAKDLFKISISRLIIIGTTLAACLSWQANASIFWAIAHGMIGWVYVFYVTKNWILLSLILGWLAVSAYSTIALYVKVRRMSNGTED